MSDLLRDAGRRRGEPDRPDVPPAVRLPGTGGSTSREYIKGQSPLQAAPVGSPCPRPAIDLAGQSPKLKA
jgi:hypothetical protein